MNVFLKGQYAGMDYISVGRIDYAYLCWCLTLEIQQETKELIYEAMQGLDVDELSF